MLHTLRNWLLKAPATGDAGVQRYLKASLGMVTGGSKSRAKYAQVTAVHRYRGWVYAAASINAYGVSSVPLRLYVKGSTGGSKHLYKTASVPHARKAYLLGEGHRSPSRTVLAKMHDFGSEFSEVTEAHPVLDLLRTVNPYMNGFDLAATRTLWQELTGNAYLQVIRNPLGVPGQLWPMPPQWVEIVPSRERFIEGYKYGKDQSARVMLAPEEVLHFKRPNPTDLYYGMGKVEAGWSVIDLNEALMEMDTSMAANHARPDYVAVINNADASDEALEEFERAINEKLRGPDKAGKFVALTGQVELKAMQMPPKDLGGRDDVVEQIAAVFGVPVTMLKANDPNLASAQSGFAQWRESTILPLLRLDEETLNQRLLPMFGLQDTAVLAYDDPVPSNRQLDLQEHQALVAAGVMTVNEVREARGLERLDMPEADVPSVAGQPMMAMPSGPALVEDTEPTAQPEPAAPAAAAPAAPQAVALNGAQVQAAQDILLAVTAGSIAPDAGKVLLTAVGLAPAQAAEAIAAQQQVQPAQVTPVPEAVQSAAASFKAMTSDAPERYAGIDFTPTEGMAAAAERGLRLREEFNRGGTEVGVARATQLKNREVLSPDTVRRMNSYFARHAVDRRPDWDDPSNPSAGFIAHLLWGGDDGKGWSARIVERMLAADKEDKSALSECVSAKIAVLVAEGYPQEQAIAMAYSHCEGQQDTKGCGCGTHTKYTDLWGEPNYNRKASQPPADPELQAIQRRLERAMVKVGRVQMEQLATKLRKTGLSGEALVNAAVSAIADEWVAAVKVAARPYMAEVVALGGKRGDAAIASAMRRIRSEEDLPPAYGFSMTNPDVGKWIDGASTRLANESGGTTRMRVRSLLGNMVEGGYTIDEMADAIEDQGFPADRARTIARTESARALVQGQVLSWKQSGIVVGKQWQVATQACEYCEAVGQDRETKDMDAPFLSLGDTVQGTDGGTLAIDYEAILGPPLHPNCRCDLMPVTKDEEQ